MSAPVQPTLLNGCARAATAAEARYRIDRPIAGRSARVVALDEDADEVVRRVGEQPWSGARFYTSASTSQVLDELEDADVVIVVATSDDGAGAASAIAQAAVRAGVMMAGLILGDSAELGRAIAALRPYAPVLMTTGDEDDLSEVLTALRA